MKLDIVIFGGGVQGLWTLAALKAQGFSVLLLENQSLGHGQTIAAQGIIHGGLKYTLSGRMTDSAVQVSEMPDRWRNHLSGNAQPDLRKVNIRSEFCYLWRTNSLRSRVGMWGAKFGLNVKPESVMDSEKPEILKDWQVMKLAEPVLSPPSLLEELARPHQDQLCLYDTLDKTGIRFENGRWQFAVQRKFASIQIDCKQVVLTAGNGNEQLAMDFKLPVEVCQMQRRPLQLAILKGPKSVLPSLNAHCLDGQKTRITVTDDESQDGSRIWQVGGDISEKFADQSPELLLAFAKQEIAALLPDLDLKPLQWTTWHGTRAERKTGDGERPSKYGLIDQKAEHIMVVWPTKMVLAPVVADEIVQKLKERFSPQLESRINPQELETPSVASPPWEVSDAQWYSTEELSEWQAE